MSDTMGEMGYRSHGFRPRSGCITVTWAQASTWAQRLHNGHVVPRPPQGIERQQRISNGSCFDHGLPHLDPLVTYCPKPMRWPGTIPGAPHDIVVGSSPVLKSP